MKRPYGWGEPQKKQRTRADLKGTKRQLGSLFEGNKAQGDNAPPMTPREKAMAAKIAELEAGLESQKLLRRAEVNSTMCPM